MLYPSTLSLANVPEPAVGLDTWRQQRITCQRSLYTIGLGGKVLPPQSCEPLLQKGHT